MTTERQQSIAQYVERASQVLDQIDYYRLLNVSSAADSNEIRSAYYRLAASLHPDIHGVDVDPAFRLKLTSVFSRVAEAYKVLANSESRHRYDRELAKGNLRMSMGADVSTSGPAVKDAGARKFYRLGQAAAVAGNFQSATMNFRFALQSEPDNETIQAALKKAEKGER